MTQPVHADAFFHDGRGPALRQAHWDETGTVLRAIDYRNPDAPEEPSGLRHVRFVAPQVVAITPEEVIDYGRLGLNEALVRFRPAALFDQGRTEWLESFAQRHLAQCRHFQLVFYDQLFDVICEAVECHRGGYRETG